MIVKFLCPTCGQKLEATTDEVGAPVTCPSCALQFVVPPPESETVLKPPLALLRKEAVPASAPVPAEETPLSLREEPACQVSAGGVDEEVERLLLDCDPALLAPAETDEAPSVPDVASAPEAGGRRPRRFLLVGLVAIPVATVLGVLAAALLGVGPGHGARVPVPPPEARAVPVPPRPPPAEEILPVFAPMDEEGSFAALGTQNVDPGPLCEEAASTLLAYLRGFPAGVHRDQVLVLALREALRSLRSADELPDVARTMYRMAGEQAVREILSRPSEEQIGVHEMRACVTGLCAEAPTAERLDWAMDIARTHAEAPLDSVDMLLACLSERTPDSHRRALVDLLMDVAGRTRAAEWGEELGVLVLSRARHCAEHEPGRGQSVLRLARRLHEAGRDDEALDLLATLARYHPSGEIRFLSSRLRLAWDRGLGAIAREGVLEEARQRHREELPAFLATIDRRALAARHGLPWPLPPSPTQSLGEVMAAAAAQVEAAVAIDFPDTRLAEIRAEAADRYRPYRIGDDVRVTIQRGNQVQDVVEGRLHSLLPSHARVGSRNVLLVDVSRLDRVRFDPEWCERERKASVEQQEAAFARKREAMRQRLLARIAEDAPRAAGYVRWLGQWVDPHELFSRALESAAEAKSEELLRRIAEEMLLKAGFALRDGEWLPVPPALPEE